MALKYLRGNLYRTHQTKIAGVVFVMLYHPNLLISREYFGLSFILARTNVTGLPPAKILNVNL